MQKHFSLLLFLFSLFSFIVISDVIAQPPLDYWLDGVQDVILDKTEAILACPGLISKSGICNEEARKIEISTISKDAEKKGLAFYYLTTGGKIVGEGANVIWDFTNAKPGKYSIIVGVGKNGALQGNFITKNISVVDCECDPPCMCPDSINISGPTGSANAGDTMIFTAKIKGGDQYNITYNWTVSEGKIVYGQGTSQILVKTSPDMKGHTVTARVEIGGLCPDCLRSASATAELRDK